MKVNVEFILKYFVQGRKEHFVGSIRGVFYLQCHLKVN